MTAAAIVIPARWGSVRFPGKPLTRIAGRTLLERAVDLGRRSLAQRRDTVLIVATDDTRVADHAAALGCQAVMTSPAIASGSGRTLAAVHRLDVPPRHVVNLQGDAPFLPVAAVTLVLDALLDGAADCATPVAPLSWTDLDELREQKRKNPTSGTTCVRAADGRAMWFSKQIIPQIRDEVRRRSQGDDCPVLRHLGLYGFSLATLERFEAAAPSFYEQVEGLEQLRLLEMGIAIRAVLVDPPSLPLGGIDTPGDAALAERLIAERGDPFGT